MNIFDIETEASKLRIKLFKTIPVRNKLLYLHNFFNLVEENSTGNLLESYILEFSTPYINMISNLDVLGMDPDLQFRILTKVENLSRIFPEAENKTAFDMGINQLRQRYEQLLETLHGRLRIEKPYYLSMPLLIKDAAAVEGNYGLNSSLAVQLKPCKDENKFHIIPSGLETDPSLKEQAADSLGNALRITAQYTKLKHRYWEIYIDFENKSGEYTGSSFGILLVLKLVEELLRFYDSPTKIISSSSAALTGQVETRGSIPSLSEEIIRKKTRIVFFSHSPLFILPEDDLPAAKDEIKKLNERYPNRKLRIIGIPLIDDLFNLRNVVEIKKESKVLRTAKFVKKQSASIILLILLAAVLFFSGLWDFDTNPTKLLYRGRFLYVMNRNEKVLWKKFLYYNESFGGAGLLRISAKIFDINSDGSNEVIVANEADTAKNNYGAFIPRITCYDNSGETVWIYEFKDTISTRTKNFPPHYEPSLIGIINQEGKSILYCFARQYQYYPGVIFSVDAKTGGRIGKTFWNSGRFADARLGDFNKDGKPEIVATGAQNSYEGNFILSINLDELDGCGPATPDYKFLGRSTAKFNKYVLIPLTDLAKYFDARYANIEAGGLDYASSTKSFRVPAIETVENEFGVMLFVFDSKLNLKDIDCSDGMQTIRDSLVVHGELNKPFTNTPEYFQSLKEKIRYWDGKKFVSRQ